MTNDTTTTTTTTTEDDTPWRNPDDWVCEHGVYVGGIGRDHLCTACEAW